jgi:hypothetical protein
MAEVQGAQMAPPPDAAAGSEQSLDYGDICVCDRRGRSFVQPRGFVGPVGRGENDVVWGSVKRKGRRTRTLYSWDLKLRV